jgi:hypothetical protein
LTPAKIAGAGSVCEDRKIAARVQILSVTSDLSVPGERCFERGGQVHDLLELGPGANELVNLMTAVLELMIAIM